MSEAARRRLLRRYGLMSVLDPDEYMQNVDQSGYYSYRGSGAGPRPNVDDLGPDRESSGHEWVSLDDPREPLIIHGDQKWVRKEDDPNMGALVPGSSAFPWEVEEWNAIQAEHERRRKAAENPVPTPVVTVPETEGSINQMLPNRGSSFNPQRLADSVSAKGATSFPTPKTKKGGMNWKAMMEAFAEQFVPEEGPSAAPGRPGPGRRPGSFKPTLAATGQGFPTGIHDMLRKKLMKGLS